MPQTAAAARTQTGEARNATMPRGFDGVPGGAPGEEVLGKRIASAVDTFRALDLFDQEPERDIHEVLIQPAAANARWNGDICTSLVPPAPSPSVDRLSRSGEKVRYAFDHFRPDPCRSRLTHRLNVLRSPKRAAQLFSS
jgi:hypothetical protein